MTHDDAARSGDSPLSRRYLAVLALAAAATLALGLLARRHLVPRSQAAIAPPSEAAAFQQLSHEAQLRRMASFLTARAEAAAPFVEYVPIVGSSGVRWRGDTVVTSLPGHTVVATTLPALDSMALPMLASDSIRRSWAVLVARSASRELVSVSAMIGGRVATRCEDVDLEEYVLDAALPPAFAGAGVFTLDGEILGMVVHCGNRLAAIPAAAVARLLAP